MIRRAFTMRLKPGALAEYQHHHDNIWPELVREIEKSGIARFYTFVRDPDLFLFSEIHDPDAWDRLWSSEIHRKWGELMEQFMHFKDGVVDFGELREIFKCEVGAGGGGTRRDGAKRSVKKAPRKKPAAKRGGAKTRGKPAKTKRARR